MVIERAAHLRRHADQCGLLVSNLDDVGNDARAQPRHRRPATSRPESVFGTSTSDGPTARARRFDDNRRPGRAGSHRRRVVVD